MNKDSGTCHDAFEEALAKYNEEESKSNLNNLLTEVLRRGYAIDFELKNGQTLLHHAVSLNMERETVQLLRSGAQILKNKYGKTPIDLALERGNQTILQLLRRSADYHKYICSKYSESGYNRIKTHSYEGGDAFGASKYAWTPLLDRNAEVTLWSSSYRLGEVYEDYLDWSDSQKCKCLQRLLDSLRVTETKFQSALDTYSERKDRALSHLRGMDRDLRNREHKYCVKIWSTVEGERTSRGQLEDISLQTQQLKISLEVACKRVFWEGEGQMRYYNGFVIKMWKRVQIRLSGASMHLSYTDISSRKSRSRVIALDCVDKVEVSTGLVMFPLLSGSGSAVTSAQGTRRSRDGSEDTTSSLSGDKLYFTFHFKPNSNSTSGVSASANSDRDSLTPRGVLAAALSESPRVFRSPHTPNTPLSRAPPPSHPIVVSVEDSPSQHMHTEGQSCGSRALLFLAALREAVMPHVEIAVAAAVLARELNEREEMEDEFYETEELDTARHRAHTGGGRWRDDSSSGLTSVESLLMSSRSSVSTSHNFSFSSSSNAPRSSSGSVGSPVDAGVVGQIALEQQLSSSLPKAFPSSMLHISPTAASAGLSGTGPVGPLNARRKVSSGTVLGRVVEEKDSCERSVSNDSSSLSGSVVGTVVSAGIVESFTDCVSNGGRGGMSTGRSLSTHSEDLLSKTPHSWDRDSFGSLIMGSGGANALARSVEEAVQHAQNSSAHRPISPVSSINGALMAECGGSRAGDDDWKSVCSDTAYDNAQSPSRKLNTEETLSLADCDNVDVTMNDYDGCHEDMSGPDSDNNTEELRIASIPLLEQKDDVENTRRPSLLSLSLQQHQVTSPPPPDIPHPHPNDFEDISLQTEIPPPPESAPMHSLTAGYGIDFDIGLAKTFTSPLRRRQSLPLQSTGSSLGTSPHLSQTGVTSSPLQRTRQKLAEENSSSMSSPPIKIPDPVTRPHDELHGTALFGSVPEAVGSTGGSTDLLSESLSHSIVPAPAHLFGTPSPHYSFSLMDSLNLQISSSVDDSDACRDMQDTPPQNALTLHMQRSAPGPYAGKARTYTSQFIKRELAAAAASSAVSVGDDDELSVDERMSASSLPAMTTTKSSLGHEQSRLLGPTTGHTTRKSSAHSRRLSEGQRYDGARMGLQGPLETGLKKALRQPSVYDIAEKLSAIRKTRDTVQERLVKYITDRENMLQILHYLQSIRRVVARPPAAPADTYMHAASPIQQIEKHNRKAFSMLTLLRNSRHNSEEAASELGSAVPGGGTDATVRSLAFSVEKDGTLLNAEESTLEGRNRDRTSSDGSSSSCSSSSTPYRSRLPPSSERHVTEAEEFVYSMMSAPMAPEQDLAQQDESGGGGTQRHASLALSISQLVGPPPLALLKEYERARKCLEEIWHCDMIIFETVEK